MKAIMYHYIRNKSKEFSNLNILKKKEFLRQINLFGYNNLINREEDFFTYKKNKIILTFDDGFKDHIYVAETLNKIGITGVFFITTGQYENNQILDVHKTQLLCAKIKPSDILEELNKYLRINKFKNFFNQREKTKFSFAYSYHNDSNDKIKIKQIFNYYGNLKLKTKALNHLCNFFEINIKANNFYLSKKEVKYLNSLGMLIGSQTKNHNLLSRLNLKNQKKEIEDAHKEVSRIIGKKSKFFCYPYGTKISYNEYTFKILKELDIKYSFIFNSKEITPFILKNRKHLIPRFDCNEFI